VDTILAALNRKAAWSYASVEVAPGGATILARRVATDGIPRRSIRIAYNLPATSLTLDRSGGA
jgi:hypothetical protein